MKPWFRSYVGMISDPKIALAALIAECAKSLAFAVWLLVLESAAKEDRDGVFTTTPRQIATDLGESVAAVARVFGALNEVAMIRRDVVVAWNERFRSAPGRAP